MNASDVTTYADLGPNWRDTDQAEMPDFADALAAVLDEVTRRPLRDHAAFLAEQSDEVREAVREAGQGAVDAAEQMRDDFLALRRVPLPDWRDPRSSVRKAG